MINFTSGTTGESKGVKITHKMMIDASLSFLSWLGDKKLGKNDIFLSYLSAGHIFETIVFSISLVSGMQFGFYAGNILKISDDCTVLKPTFIISIPRILNRIHRRIQKSFESQSSIKRYVIQKAINSKLA